MDMEFYGYEFSNIEICGGVIRDDHILKINNRYYCEQLKPAGQLA
jgi:hypothetical protein